MALSQAYLEWERQTRAQGIEQGIERGKVNLVLMQLRSRLGTLPQPIETQIQNSSGALDQLAIALLNITTLEELEQWLQAQN